MISGLTKNYYITSWCAEGLNPLSLDTQRLRLYGHLHFLSLFRTSHFWQDFTVA